MLKELLTTAKIKKVERNEYDSLFYSETETRCRSPNIKDATNLIQKKYLPN
jgi:hypothetical protein